MPSTQAYSVNWDVRIQPEGVVSGDVAELKVIEQSGKPNSATVTLDTSESPHALEEQKAITIEIEDGNTTINFVGITDSVKDDDERPIVTVDARESSGLLKDTTVAGTADEPNLFQVIKYIIDDGPSDVREIAFDAASLESQYGTFAGATDFGSISIAHYPQFGANTDSFSQHETAAEETEAELRIDSYVNSTAQTYVLEIDGQDGAGNTVEASVDLPPGEDAQDAYGTDTFKLALSGGNERIVQIDSISTNVPEFTSGSNVQVGLSGNIFNYVKTNWQFSLDNLTSVDEQISQIVRYISSLDDANDWEYYVEPRDGTADELIVQPKATATPDRYVFREGDNVLKPVASRDLDGVRNFIKVSGAGDVNSWHWAYNGELQSWIVDNPFEDGTFPSGGAIFGSGQAPQNHIDQINLRGEALSSNTFTSSRQAIEVGKKALKEYLRTPVSGQAPVPGIHPADPGDEAEVYYPSRGIPSKVSDNVFSIEKVEYTVTPETAKTTIDFGTSKRNLGDLIGSGGSLVRNDISGSIRQFSTRTGQATEEGAGGGLLVVGELISQNDDGTWKVKGEDGNTYENVRVI